MNFECPETHSNITIPKEYQELLEVFSKAKATGLPSYRHLIGPLTLSQENILEATEFTYFSLTEQVMDESMQEALQQGYISL